MKRERKKKTENTVDMAFKGILCPDAKQENLIARTLGCCRFIYNYALAERISVYESTGKSISYYDQCKTLTLMKKNPEFSWLREVDSTAEQYSLRSLQDAFDNFFRGLKEGYKTGYPKFKSKHDTRQSYHTMNNNDSIAIVDSRHIRLPKLGIVRCRIPRLPRGRIIHATITGTPDFKYEISIFSEEPKKCTTEYTGKAVGIDLGIKNIAITSDDEKFDNPKSLLKNTKKLIRAQRKLLRKQSGSSNCAKQRIKLAKIHKKIRNQRIDAIHKMTISIVRRYDIICIEDLDVKSMMKNKRIAKYLSDVSLGEVRRQLTYKAEWYGKTLITVDRWYPSTQTCSECGYVNTKTKNIGVRYWKCPVCGQEHDRDINAAKNILMQGMIT